MADNRVLVIGLDGATWDVLEPFIADGDLPHLERLRSNGCWGDLASTIPPLSAPAWATFLTGKSPARHGVFHFVEWESEDRRSGDAQAGLVDGRSIDSPTLWDVLGHEDKSVVVINVPMSYPPRPVRGALITGLLTPPGAPVFTHPPELSEQLSDYQIDLDRFIADKPFAEPGSKRSVKPDMQLIDEFTAMESIRGETALRLMESEPWDVFTVVFTGTDRMGHYLWPYHRREDLDGSAEGDALHEGVRTFYRTLDRMIGRLVETAGPETAVVVISDHGMGPIYTKNTHWNTWLYKQGYVKLAESAGRTLDGWLLRLRIPRDRLRSIASRLPGGTSRGPGKALKRAQTAQLDRTASTAYFERWFDPIGGIRVNAGDRDRDEVIAELIDAIGRLTDPETGATIARGVYRREECLSGPYLEQAPDIIIVMKPEYGSSDRLSNYSAIVTDRPRIGDPGGHQIEGVFVASGAGIVADGQEVSGLSIDDIAPTVLHLAGAAVPDDMDGSVVTSVLAPQGPHDRPVRQAGSSRWWPDESVARSGRTSTEDEDDAVRDRLRALGYFE